MAVARIQYAVQYVRMSTDAQELSPAVQRSAMQAYANANGLCLVGTYEDEGRSGLSLKQRPAMRHLLEDVQNIERLFDTILVYDVSRWGRFQDTDASAYYEYHCRLHGVRVVYVKESFLDDGLPLNTVLKSIKRAMAAEYSRELKVKSRSGQELAIRRGFQMGKLPCIGFRRFTVPSDGSPGRQLGPNERKPRLTDRVRWVPGPVEEVELVRRIFTAYSQTNITIKRLVAILKEEGRVDSAGRRFTHRMLSGLLRCEAFSGTFVWGRREDRTGVIRQPGDEGYTRACDVVEALVTRDVWERAQQKRRLGQNRRRTKQEAIDELRRALASTSSFAVTDLAGAGCATECVYRRLFGSFEEALRLAGRSASQVKTAYVEKIARMRSLGARFRRDLVEVLKAGELDFTQPPRSNMLILNNGIRVAVQLIWRRNGRFGLTWWLRKHFSTTSDYVLVVRMEANETAQDFLLIATRLYVQHAPWFHDPGEGALVLHRPQELVSAMRELKLTATYRHVPGSHRRLRYVTPLPIDVEG